MVKGINRQVIEVIDTGSEIYERALLVIRPECTDTENKVLEKEARRLLNDLGAPSSAQKKKNILYWVIRLGGAAAVGAGLTFAAIFI